jgi:predicted ester cyclase
MSAKQNQAIVHRLIHELLNCTDLAVADEIVAPGYVDHDPVLGGASGPKGLKQLSLSLRAAFPDGHFTVNDQFAAADRVVTRWAFHGTQLGEFASLPARGEDVWLTAVSIHRLADGLIQEGWTGLERVKWGSREGSTATALGRIPG